MQDIFGLELSTNSEPARDAYNQALSAIMEDRSGAEAAYLQAIQSDPTFAIAYIDLARLQFARGDTAHVQKYIALANQHAAQATDRERSHISAISKMLTQDLRAAIEEMGFHIRRHPRDFLIATILLNHIFFHGGKNKKLEVNSILADLEPHYRSDPRFLARKAFHRSEDGDISVANHLLRECAKQNFTSALTLHAQNHALLASNNYRESARLLASAIPHLDQDTYLYGHLVWHLALAHLEMMETEKAFKVYIDSLKSSEQKGHVQLDFADDVGFLFRLSLSGFDGQPEWITSTRYHYEKLANNNGPFVVFHKILFLAYAKNFAEMDLLLKQHEKSAIKNVLKAIAEFAHEKYALSYSLFSKLSADEKLSVGGSNFERSLIDELHLEAAIHAGDYATALKLPAANPGHPSATRLNQRRQYILNLSKKSG